MLSTKGAEHPQIRSMKPSLPGLPTVAALMLCAIIAAWLGIAGPIDASKLQNWQPLIAAIIAAAGIVIGASNFGKQLRISILNREEDRIEKQLPGLYDAAHLCRSVIEQLRPIHSFFGVVQFINDNLRLGGSPKSFEGDVEELLPVTDAATRRGVTSVLFGMYSRAIVAQGTRAHQTQLENLAANPKEWEPSEYQKARAEITSLSFMLVSQGNDFQRAIDRIEGEGRAIARKIDTYERRLARIRGEIESFFNDEE
jgi:hypothetical protein